MFGCRFWHHPTPRGSGSWCVCLGSGFTFTSPIVAGVFGCVCLSARTACTPPILAGVLGCVCLCARSCLYPAIPGLVVRCGCVCLGLVLCLRPAIPGWGVWVCVYLTFRPRCCAFGLYLWPFWVISLIAPSPPGWGCPVSVCLSFSLFCLCLFPFPFFLFLFFAAAVSGLLCLLAPGALSLGAASFRPPPAPPFLCPGCLWFCVVLSPGCPWP